MAHIAKLHTPSQHHMKHLLYGSTRQSPLHGCGTSWRTRIAYIALTVMLLSGRRTWGGAATGANGRSASGIPTTDTGGNARILHRAGWYAKRRRVTHSPSNKRVTAALTSYEEEKDNEGRAPRALMDVLYQVQLISTRCVYKCQSQTRRGWGIIRST